MILEEATFLVGSMGTPLSTTLGERWRGGVFTVALIFKTKQKPKKHNKLTRSGGSESVCLFLREENLCWLRAEKRRKDSRLREARCLKEDVRLKGVRPAGSPLVRSWPTVVVTKLRASWKDLLTVPIHWVMWVWATVSLSPR